MGPALGWALTQTPAAALAVFLALGLGFAAPFVLVAFAPGLLARLPRPGAWMETFRKALAFPMYGAAAWLAWVLAQQAGRRRPRQAVRRRGRAWRLAAWLARPAPSAARRWAASRCVARRSARGRAGGRSPSAARASGRRTRPPSCRPSPTAPRALAELRAEGRPVFVNYTAAWCVTCQVNDKVALSTHAVAAGLRAPQGRLSEGRLDQARRRPSPPTWPATAGPACRSIWSMARAAATAVILPSILTPDIVVKAVEAADKR